jgi:hypothetical protein
MSCNCGCNSGCGCDPNPCHKPCTTTSTTSTTTIPCIGEQCDELYDCECVRYIGEDLLCYGIKNGTTLCEIIQIINDEICKLGPVATTTLRDCRFGTLTATILTTTTTIAPTTTTSSTSTTTSSTTSTTTVSCTYNGGSAFVVLPTTQAPTTIPPAPTTTTTIDEPIIIDPSLCVGCPPGSLQCKAYDITITQTSSMAGGSLPAAEYIDCVTGQWVSIDTVGSITYKCVCGCIPPTVRYGNTAVWLPTGSSCPGCPDCFFPTTSTTTSSPCKCYSVENTTPDPLNYQYTQCGGSGFTTVSLAGNTTDYVCSETVPAITELGIVVNGGVVTCANNLDCVP